MYREAFFVMYACVGTLAVTHPQELGALQQFKRMNHASRLLFIRRLEATKDLLSLQQICDSGESASEFAASVLALRLEPRQAIQLCQSHKPGTLHWRYALWGLGFQKKDLILVYFMECGKSSDPEIRWFSYKIALRQQWPEWVEFAKADLHNNSRIVILNQEPDELTLAALARKYLEFVDKFK